MQDATRLLGKMSAYGDKRFRVSPRLPLSSIIGENRSSVTGQSASASEGEAISTTSFAV